jgi:hypothetical protein
MGQKGRAHLNNVQMDVSLMDTAGLPHHLHATHPMTAANTQDSSAKFGLENIYQIKSAALRMF